VINNNDSEKSTQPERELRDVWLTCL